MKLLAAAFKSKLPVKGMPMGKIPMKKTPKLMKVAKAYKAAKAVKPKMYPGA